MGTKDTDDQDVEGRLHDGFAYCVELANGRRARFCDHDKLDVILLRLEELEAATYGEAEKAPAEDYKAAAKFQARWGRTKLKFSGARDKTTEAMLDEDGEEVEDSERDVIGKVDGKGFVLAQHVVAISYWGQGAELYSDAAYEAAAAVEGARRDVAEVTAEVETKKAAQAMAMVTKGTFGQPQAEEEETEEEEALAGAPVAAAEATTNDSALKRALKKR